MLDFNYLHLFLVDFIICKLIYDQLSIKTVQVLKAEIIQHILNRHVSIGRRIFGHFNCLAVGNQVNFSIMCNQILKKTKQKIIKPPGYIMFSLILIEVIERENKLQYVAQNAK